MELNEKDINRPKENVPDDRNVAVFNALSLSLFSGSRRLHFLYVKAEKLASAVYLVTELLPEINPVKSRSRTVSIELISHVLDFLLAIRSRVATDEHRQKVLASIQEMVSLARVALANPGASRMNFMLLEREYERLLGDVASLSGMEASEQVITEEYLTVSVERQAAQESPSFYAPGDLYKKQEAIKDIKFGKHQSATVRQKMSDKTLSVLNSTGGLKGHDDKKMRAEAVLKVISESGGTGLGIKEIVRAVPGYSEKTIQRLLADLVLQGVIKKQGERRWSTYSLSNLSKTA